MTQKQQDVEKAGLSPEELEAQNAADLPDREAMSLLDLNLDLDLGLSGAAPIDAAVAANANVAAPIDASVAANVGSVNSIASSTATQNAGITQTLDGVAIANSNQDSVIAQGDDTNP
jgi:hypothetical protein